MSISGQALDFFEVEGIKVHTLSVLEAARAICAACLAKESFNVFTINLDHIVKLRKDMAFRSAYQKCKYVLADGFPIALIGRLLGKKVARTAGSDLIDPLCNEASRQGLKVVFFGSSFDVLKLSASRLKAKYPALEIAGIYAPPYNMDFTSSDASDAVDFLKRSEADICFVALGAPKQEVFSDLCCSQISGMSFICIGAGLDFIAGVQKRAPKIVQDLNCEWLWRMMGNPKRLALRYLQCALVLPSLLMRSFFSRQQA